MTQQNHDTPVQRFDLGRPLGIRWTIGNVSNEGFEALRLSIWGAWRIFGAQAEYAVCFNTVALNRAQDLTGPLPEAVMWIDATSCVPDWLKPHLDPGMAEGVGWKFAPLRLFPDRYELALDNDCILWALPRALQQTLMHGASPRCVIAADVRAWFGQFADLCGTQPCNSGIRGTPAEFDLEAAISSILAQRQSILRSEGDEQGLQVAALKCHSEPLVVCTDEVSICSPFPPHAAHLGRCGAHFVGLNAHRLPWAYYGRPASEVRREHWRERRVVLYERMSITPRVPDLMT